MFTVHLGSTEGFIVQYNAGKVVATREKYILHLQTVFFS